MVDAAAVVENGDDISQSHLELFSCYCVLEALIAVNVSHPYKCSKH